LESKPLSLGLDLTKAKKMKNFILEFHNIEELIDIKNDVIQYLDDVLSKIAAYINSEGYKSMIA